MRRPKPIRNPDLTVLISNCQYMMADIAAGTYHEDNVYKHYIYEEALKAIYGKDVFDYVNKWEEIGRRKRK